MSNRRSIWLIDGCGGLVVSVLLVTMSWYAFFKPDTASSQIEAVAADVAQGQADLQQLQSALSQGGATRQALMSAAEEQGHLPQRSPVDQDLQTITGFANASNVKFLQVQPISTVLYPNVQEQRYRIRTVGTFSDHLRFFQAFEACSFWADITYVKLEQTMTGMNQFDAARQSDMTLSFYSALQ